MKSEIKTPVLIATVVALVAVVGFLIFKYAGADGGLDQGQVKYTPGVPPWMDKQNGANQPSGVGQPGAPSNQASAGYGPPGMTPSTVGGNETK